MTASGFGRWPRALPSGSLLALTLLLPACTRDPVHDQAGSPTANATDEIAAAPDAIPPNPNAAAISEMMKKTSAHLSMMSSPYECLREDSALRRWETAPLGFSQSTPKPEHLLSENALIGLGRRPPNL